MRRSDISPTLLARLTGAGIARTAGLLGRLARPRRARTDRDGPGFIELATIETVDDPDGSIRLIAVSGIVELHTVDALAAAIFDDPCVGVHLDLSGVAGWMPGVVRQLERVLDEAELLAFRLRVIGLDPDVLTMPDQLSA